MSAETSLYRHIYSMLFTTVPSFLIALILFTLIGTRYGNSELAGTQIEIIRAALSSEYRLGPLITLLPIVLLATLSIRRVAAEVAMSASILLAVLIAILYQQSDTSQVLNALWTNSPGTTGIENLDNLLGRGGIFSMAWTLILAIMALALGGLMHGGGFLRVLLSGIIARVQRVASLVATTLVSGLIGNMAMGEAYISIILNCQLFQLKYRERGLDPAILSRTVEEGSTLTTGLIPWTTAGAFYSATLGISALDYAPYAFFNYLNAMVAVTMASAGLGCCAAAVLYLLIKISPIHIPRRIELLIDMGLFALRTPTGPAVGQFLKPVNPAQTVAGGLGISNGLITHLKPDRISKRLCVGNIHRKAVARRALSPEMTPAAALNLKLSFQIIALRIARKLNPLDFLAVADKRKAFQVSD